MSDYIICYDIANPRRLGRVHRALKRLATPLQYSVFLFTGSEQQLQRCLDQLESIIDSRADDLRAYPLPTRGLRYSQGTGAIPEGILWV